MNSQKPTDQTMLLVDPNHVRYRCTHSSIIVLSIPYSRAKQLLLESHMASKFRIDRFANRWTRCFLKILENDVRYGTELGGSRMFATKWRNFGASFAVVALGTFVGSIEPALAGLKVPVPAPLLGAGLPAMAVLAGGYWLVRKLRRPR
jgi:hypothetical protein